MVGYLRGSSSVTTHSALPCPKSHASSAGQSLVELALLLPIMIMMLAVAGDFGRALTAHIAIGSAAREGAAYGMQSANNAADQDGMRAAVLAETPSVWNVEPTVSFPSCSDPMPRPYGGTYQCVAVTVHYEFRPILTIGPIPSMIPMERTVEMRVVN
jgi:hypothetical protein